jgi:hypothetical protein
MAHSQVDPTRLQGAELTRWYLRSPSDIERERQEAAQRRYDNFFAPTERSPQPAGAQRVGFSDESGTEPSGQWVQSGPNRWSSQAAPKIYAATRMLGAGSVAVQPTPDDHICRGCHWGGAPPSPPGVAPLPRDIPPSSPSPSKPPERDRKQCEQQLESDTDICGQQANDQSKAICRGDAMNRYAHCRQTGEVGIPSLFNPTRRRPR